MAETQERAPGREAITEALESLYGSLEPFHFGTTIPYSLGGPDPLDGISVYWNDHERPHWHYVTYGFSELYEKETDDPEYSGYGFELTFRLAAEHRDEQPPTWPLHLLQNLARYVFDSGNVFDAGHHLDLNGAICLDADTEINAIVFAPEPQLPPMSTENGAVQMLQVVGITFDELRAARRWNSNGLLRLLSMRSPLLITDLRRGSIMSDSAMAEAVNQGAREEGSSTGVLYCHQATWQASGNGHHLTLGASLITELCEILPNRIRHGKSVVIAGQDKSVRFEPSGSLETASEDDVLIVRLTDAATESLVSHLAPVRGKYELPELSALFIEVVRTEIADREGNVVETIG